jgi:hypothetical protein
LPGAIDWPEPAKDFNPACHQGISRVAPRPILPEVSSQGVENTMKTPLILTAVALIAVGCDRPKNVADNRSVEQGKDSIQKSAREAKSAIEKEAESKKDIIEAEAKSAQAKLDADKARVKAATAEAQTKVDAATDSIRNAGAAGTRVQTEVGTSPTTVTPPTPAPTQPSTVTTVPPTPPTPVPSPSAATDDQKLAEQVRTTLAPADATTAPSVQVTAAPGGVVTLKGTVKTEAEKSRMEAAAKAVAGVTKVENQIEVKAE